MAAYGKHGILKKIEDMDDHLPRVVAVVGPTASGKTALGLRLAHLLQGEVVNADSRQIYAEISIGTGKPRGEYQVYEGQKTFVVDGIPHHLMDCIDPRYECSVVEWRLEAMKVIRAILERQHLPIVVGGTGLYISALIDQFVFPSVPPNPALRDAFNSKSLEELVKLLVRLDPDAQTAVDLHNPRRVIRALEVATFTGKSFTAQKKKAPPMYDVFQVGIAWDREKLYERIHLAMDDMIARGWIIYNCNFKRGRR
jgi:tRNA dimethylallyltransferase